MTRREIGIGTFRTTPRIRALLNQIMETGQVSYGPISLEFEKRFAGIHGCQYGILSNSGTSSLHVALQAMKEIHGWERGHVIVPCTTFVATANIVTHNRMVPVFVDVDPQTYNIDPALVEQAITQETKAIIPVSLFGQPANLSAIVEIAKRHDLKVIEDSCETMFARHKGLTVGAWGDIACFSMYVAHLLVAGVGGIATTNNADYAAKMRSLNNHGLNIENLNPGDNFSPRPMLGRRFVFDTVGHSFRQTEFESALALGQLDDVDAMLTRRRANATHLKNRLDNINAHYGLHFQTPITADGNEHAWMMFCIVLDGNGKGRKAELVNHLNQYGIQTRDALPILGQPIFSYLNPRNYPVSQNLVDNALYVGIHQGLNGDDMEYMADVFGTWAAPDGYQSLHL